MNASKREIFLPRRPQYVKVRLDADMAPEGPLYGGKWPGRERVLTYHSFDHKRLRRGERVCVNAGVYQDVFGTVIGRSRRWRRYTFGVRRAEVRQVTVLVEVEQTTEFEVA